MSLGVLMTESVTEGIEHPVGPAVVYSFAFAAALTFAIWIVGYAIASIGGWLLPRQRSI
jgi:hypothetical protein